MEFLQVFWDPNRQDIYDKIFETLVIDLSKPKFPFIKKMAE
jgi:antirestriction protein ArdC